LNGRCFTRRDIDEGHEGRHSAVGRWRFAAFILERKKNLLFLKKKKQKDFYFWGCIY
jgi:hypothetical protein